MAPAADSGPQDRAAGGRRAELVANLAVVRARIGSACASAGRRPEAVTIVAVTKTRPVSDVRLVAGLGLTDVGESRDQEAAPKAAACADLGLTWHFVGQLQRNKAASVALYADVVQSVDRAVLVEALDRAAQRAGRRMGACIQVDLQVLPGPPGPGHRGGASPADAPGLADLVAGSASLDLRGVMAVAPLGAEPAEAFERLVGIHERILADHPGATMRSAGMSADLEEAVRAGATHVRVGSALLGHRVPLK